MLKIIFIVDNLACTENQTNMVPHVCSRIICVREGCACWARGKGKENQFKVDSTLETKPWVTGDSEKYGFSSLFFSVSFRLWPRFPGPLGFFSHCLCLDLPTAPCAVWLSTNKQHGFLPSLSSCTQLLRLQFACPGAFPLNFSKIILKLKKKKKVQVILGYIAQPGIRLKTKSKILHYSSVDTYHLKLSSLRNCYM